MTWKFPAAVGAVCLAACASTPSTVPGQGAGVNYLPVVDMQGVDAARFSADVAACRQYAGYVDERKEGVEGVIGGALASALLMQAAGGNRNQIGQAANVGGLAGSFRAADRSIGRQEQIIKNCLAGRGYRVLDGATVMVAPTVAAPPPPAAAVAAPTAERTVAAQPPGAGMPAAVPAAVTTTSFMTSDVMRPAQPLAKAPEPYGQDSPSAQRLAKEQGCTDNPKPIFGVKGPGFETYTIACTNGEALSIRCEFGNCRVLR